MSDIFISYRRKDAWAAGRIDERLRQSYGTFFDTRSILPGTRFPERLQQALDACSVLLAIIGPGWVGWWNRRRLYNESDWVRRELELALGKPDTLVVPVLVDGTELPALPEALQELSNRQAIKVSSGQWDSDIAGLSKVIAERLSRSALQFRNESQQIVKLDLPYLCDRVEQEQALTDSMCAQASPSALAVTLHGHKWEAHDGFLNRLKQKQVLEDLLDARDTGVDICHLQWSRDRVIAGDYDGALMAALRSDLLHARRASVESVLRHFATLRQPLVLTLQITWADHVDSQGKVLSGFESAWSKLMTGVSLPRSVLLWINVCHESPDDRIPVASSLQLPELVPVLERHIAEWLLNPAVKPYAARIEGDVRKLPSDSRYGIGGGRMHMQSFVDQTRLLISALT